MSTNQTEVNLFESMLNELIEMIRKKIQNYFQSKEKRQSENQTKKYNTNSSPLSCSVDDEQWMEHLTVDITERLRCVEQCDENNRKFMLNLLVDFGFDRSKMKFKETLTLNRIDSFINLLELIRDSPKGFLSAWNGDLNGMKVYLTKYPSMKDAPGPWQTTFIYSAARQNHLELVKCLVEDMKCSINAQNQQHIDKALAKTEFNSRNFAFDPKSASTALHGACYWGHVEVVKYLVEHGADYYLRNQAFETSLDSARGQGEIILFFKKLLNRGFIEEADHLPGEPIREIHFRKDRKDCVCEYFEFQGSQWKQLASEEAKELNEALIVNENETMKREIQLNCETTLSIVEFLRLKNEKERDGWLRCRGSSILNFDCFARWQMIFIGFESMDPGGNQEMSMKMFDLSKMHFEIDGIQLKTWYNCDDEINEMLDKGIDNRRREINIRLSCLNDRLLKFDLRKFSFENLEKTIFGYLRWIPKLIDRNRWLKKNKEEIDNFGSMINVQVLPWTREFDRKFHQQSEDSIDEQPIIDEVDEFSNEVDEDEQEHSVDDRNENQENWAVEEILSTKHEVDKSMEEKENLIQISTVTEAEKFHEENQEIKMMKKKLEETQRKLNELLAENQENFSRRKFEDSEKKSQEEKHEKELNEKINEICRLNKELEEKENFSKRFQEEKQRLGKVQYGPVDVKIYDRWISTKFNEILEEIKRKTEQRFDFNDQFPTIIPRREDSNYYFVVRDFPEHHNEFHLFGQFLVEPQKIMKID